MKIEAIYARQSIDKKDSVSIEAQIDKCKSFLTNDDCEIYFDKGWSGKNTDRPMMNKLIEDVKNDKISRIVAYRLDRISRNIVDFGNLLKLFEDHNVEFISANENFETSSPMGRAMVYIVMVFAQLERETIATRIEDNYKFRCSTGKFFMGGGVPFGYKTEKTLIEGKNASIIIPNENAAILKDIFDKFLSGYTFYQIVHDLNNQNIKTATGKLWTPNGIRRILTNITPCVADEQVYHYLSAFGYNISNQIEEFDGKHGMCIFMKNKNKNIESDVKDQIVAVGIHEPIISSDKYIKAQLLIDKNSKIKAKKGSNRSFLAGLIKCGECNYSFGLKTTLKKDKTYAYYYCRSRHTRGVCSNDLYVNAEELENYILERCINYLTLNSTKQHKTQKTKKINLAEETTLLEQQISNIINNIGKGNEVVDNLLTNKITELQNKIEKLKQENQVNLYENSNKEIVSDLLNKCLNFNEYNIQEKKAIINQLVKNITISKNKKIDITYKIKL